MMLPALPQMVFSEKIVSRNKRELFPNDTGRQPKVVLLILCLMQFNDYQCYMSKFETWLTKIITYQFKVKYLSVNSM